MLKYATTIKLSGAIFASETSFRFFNPHENDKLKLVKGTLLYGRNGSGKSTISRAFSMLSGALEPSISSASLYDDAGQIITLTEEDRKHIFVFNEDYVDRNVRLQQDHLDTIVMLGQAADLTGKIAKAEAEREAAEITFKKREEALQEYLSNTNPKSPDYYMDQIIDALRGDDNWAGRDREINDNRHNTSVKYDTYKKFVNRTPSKSKTELFVDFKTQLDKLKAAKAGSDIIDLPVPSLPDSYNQYNDEEILKLLSEKIEKPELSEREKKLFALMQAKKTDELEERLFIFKAAETADCPYCFQPISKEYKESLVEDIEKVLSKAVEDHINALRGYIREEISLDLITYIKLKEEYQACIDLVKQINSAIRVNNNNITNKINNPFNPILAEKTTVSILISQLKTALIDLESARIKHNQDAKKTAPIKEVLNDINSDIAHYDVANLAAQYEKQKTEKDDAETEYASAEKEYLAKNQAVVDLEVQRKNLHLALEEINACLNYIFFSNNRLKIEYVDGEYKLLVNGKRVAPQNVSVGERNAIGLSYFFTSILEAKEQDKAYGENYLLIIDDPVSSFDTENRIGIMSFLKYKLSVFLEGNKDTKALVMTHDLRTAYDIQKVFEEIIDGCKRKGWNQGLKYYKYELQDNVLIDFINKRQEYTEIIKIVYDYAFGQTDQHEMVIGNLMRQALEAFSTFQYKRGIEDVSNDTEILELLPGEEYISYYRNLMYRLVLHGGSHKEEQIKTMQDYNFFSLISETEKKRTAKDILCFIYLLNERHLLEHLKDRNCAKTELQFWCQEIKNRSVGSRGLGKT